MDSLLVCLIAICGFNNETRLMPLSNSSSISISFPLSSSAPDKWLGEDKLKHFALSYMITVGGYAGARFVAGHAESVMIGAGIGLAAGVAKELYDRKNKRSASLRDLIWDAAGIATGLMIAAKTR